VAVGIESYRLVAHLQQESKTQPFSIGSATERHASFAPRGDRPGFALKFYLGLHLRKFRYRKVRIGWIIVETFDDLPSFVITADAEKPTWRKW